MGVNSKFLCIFEIKMKTMKTIDIPRFSFEKNESIDTKIKTIKEQGVKAAIDQVNWEKEFPYSLPVSVYAGHDNHSLYLYYTITGEIVRTENNKDFGSVWEDSCVEFFMMREGEKNYRNFECNAIGSLLASTRESKESAQPLTDDIPTINRYVTLQHRYEKNQKVTDWTLFLEIPKKAMGFASDESISGKILKGNFYKCGDKTENIHFLSWNPIDLPSPNFHDTRFFGTLRMK